MSGLNKDDIIRMAKEAGLYTKCEVHSAVPFDQLLTSFAELIAAAEREVCVKDVSNALYGQDGCGKAIEAIRARG
jgi:hypothetical protein